MHDLEGLFCKTVVSGINDKIAKTKKKAQAETGGHWDLTMGLGPS